MTRLISQNDYHSSSLAQMTNAWLSKWLPQGSHFISALFSFWIDEGRVVIKTTYEYCFGRNEDPGSSFKIITTYVVISERSDWLPRKFFPPLCEWQKSQQTVIWWCRVLGGGVVVGQPEAAGRAEGNSMFISPHRLSLGIVPDFVWLVYQSSWAHIDFSRFCISLAWHFSPF